MSPHALWACVSKEGPLPDRRKGPKPWCASSRSPNPANAFQCRRPLAIRRQVSDPIANSNRWDTAANPAKNSRGSIALVQSRLYESAHGPPGKVGSSAGCTPRRRRVPFLWPKKPALLLLVNPAPAASRTTRVSGRAAIDSLLENADYLAYTGAPLAPTDRLPILPATNRLAASPALR